MRWIASLCTVALGAALMWSLGTVGAEEPKVSEIQVGDKPGAFALNDHEGKAVRLGGGEGHGWFVLAFYPKAMTGGCTKEVCSLRDNESALSANGVKVYGVSLDDVVSQKAFHGQQKLSFPLLSDPDGSVAARYRTLPEGAKWTQRVTFVVDPEGVVRHVDRAVQVGTHGADLLQVVAGLVAPSGPPR
jgi:peroxiredoxin Q/BCP